MFYTYKVLECLCSCMLRLYFLYICIFPYFIHTKLWRYYAVGHWACIFCKPSSDLFSRKTPTFLAHQSTGNRKKITMIRPYSLDFTISYLHQSLHQSWIRLTCSLDSPMPISSNTTVRKALGRVKLFSSGFMFIFRWATADIGFITTRRHAGQITSNLSLKSWMDKLFS